MVAVLHRHRVQFVVIGGFAIQLHQVAGLARTSDIDVTPERSRRTSNAWSPRSSSLTHASVATAFPTKAYKCRGTSTYSNEWISRST